MANVRFYFGTQAKFDALVEKNPIALYFIEDTQRLYKGDVLIASGAGATAMASGLMSAADKAKLDALTVDSGINKLDPADSTIIMTEMDDGGKSIGVAVSTKDDNSLVVVDDGLFVNLATTESAGAMSAKDKIFIDSIPDAYATKNFVKETAAQVKYEISSKPEGAIVNYSEKEIRVMCPANTKWVKQNVGVTGNSNMYYMGFKAYAPEGAVSFKEGDKGVIIDEMFTFDDDFAGIDEFGRKYSIVWLALASYDAASDSWSYFGKNSSSDKYVGWDYCVEWYSESNVLLAKDSIRINLTNEDCYENSIPYYMNNYATIEQITKLEENLVWSEITEF